MQLVPHLLGQFPALARKLAGANRTTDARARGPLFSRVPRPARDGLLLLGDAAGYIDPITGEGVGLALAQARLLARHLPAISSTSAAQLCENAFEPYLRAERRLVRSHVVLTRLLLGLRRAPGLMERAIRALSEDPQLFATFLSINQGAKPLRSLSFVSALGLARRIALAPKLELGR
jgi:flavin-dependent dehydrogenase